MALHAVPASVTSGCRARKAARRRSASTTSANQWATSRRDSGSIDQPSRRRLAVRQRRDRRRGPCAGPSGASAGSTQVWAVQAVAGTVGPPRSRRRARPPLERREPFWGERAPRARSGRSTRKRAGSAASVRTRTVSETATPDSTMSRASSESCTAGPPSLFSTTSTRSASGCIALSRVGDHRARETVSTMKTAPGRGHGGAGRGALAEPWRGKQDPLSVRRAARPQRGAGR